MTHIAFIYVGKQKQTAMHVAAEHGSTEALAAILKNTQVSAGMLSNSLNLHTFMFAHPHARTFAEPSTTSASIWKFFFFF